MRGDLNYRQEQFCRNYVANGGKNGTQAAKDAGYADSSASVQSIALLKQPKIQSRIEELRGQLSNQAGIDPIRVLQEEQCLAFADIAMMFDECGNLKAPKDMPEIIRRAIAGVKVTETMTQANELKTTYEYKFWSKGDALTRIERYLGMYAADQPPAQQPSPTQINIDRLMMQVSLKDLSDMELEAISKLVPALAPQQKGNGGA